MSNSSPQKKLRSRFPDKSFSSIAVTRPAATTTELLPAKSTVPTNFQMTSMSPPSSLTSPPVEFSPSPPPRRPKPTAKTVNKTFLSNFSSLTFFKRMSFHYFLLIKCVLRTS
ncbi:hypothetical protein L3Y34_001599 [Caenorhabditis briggsae]|uniref:Uncharacterized protein n=1 Tax=Caenorhabditis briggsae TaxID=6238 RepID=A0AAE9DD55_CAEBR|nr:hypothetical protein L3Y34_001599 [Caenorhabditis briggsae]